MIKSTILLAQVPRDTSYTVDNTVKKVQKQYPDMEVEGVQPHSFESVSTTNNIVYKNTGRDLMANLFVPKTDANGFAVLLIHGGGWRAGSPALMTPIAKRLAEEGFLVMVPEYRLSLESIYPAAVNDLKDAISWVEDNHGIPRTEIVIMGCSAGGQLAALIGTTTPVMAIVDVDGVLAFKHPDSEEGAVAAQWLGGNYNEIPKVWKEASALTHVSDNTPPTLFLASKYPRFLAGRQEYMKVLQNAGTFTEVKFLNDAPHSFWLLTPWFEPTMNYTIDFLNRVINTED